MASDPDRQQTRATEFLTQRGMARLRELKELGITGATLSRMEKRGDVIRLARGLYQLPDAPLDANHSLAEAAKLVPRGVVCAQSALAFHDLTDRMPARVWMAIGPGEWRPQIVSPPLQILRFGPKVFSGGVEEHEIEGVQVPIYGVAKTIADEFRLSHQAGGLYRKSLGYDLTLAIEALKRALRQGKATPAEIAHFAIEAGPKTWEVLRPYLEALTIDG